MKCRGYGIKGRTNYSNYRFLLRDLIIIILLIILFIPVLISLESLPSDYYPQINFMVYSIEDTITYCLFAILITLPMILNVKEDIKWAYIESKI